MWMLFLLVPIICLLIARVNSASSSTKSFGGAYPEVDYGVDQHTDPENFYTDLEDEFEDYEDAKEYFYEYRD